TRVDQRIVDRHRVRDVIGVRAAERLRQVQRVAVRMADGVEARPAVEAARLDDQRVAVPPPEGETGSGVVAVRLVVTLPVLFAGRRKGQIGLAGLIPPGPGHVRNVRSLPDAAQVGWRRGGRALLGRGGSGQGEEAGGNRVNLHICTDFSAHDTPGTGENAFDFRPVELRKYTSSVYAIWRGGIRMKTKLALGTAALGLLLAAVPVMAHHSFAAEFDSNKPIKMTGTVTKIEWMNPHAYFYIDVKDAAGKVTNWGLE